MNSLIVELNNDEDN